MTLIFKCNLVSQVDRILERNKNWLQQVNTHLKGHYHKKVDKIIAYSLSLVTMVRQHISPLEKLRLCPLISVIYQSLACKFPLSFTVSCIFFQRSLFNDKRTT
jgi:hypothetical protein